MILIESNVHHRYFPYDIEFLIKNFLNVWKPNYIFLVDSEIWPNLILLAKNQKIPLALINARITVKTFNKWIKFPKTAKKIFGGFDLCLTSNDESKHYSNNIDFKSDIDIEINPMIDKSFEYAETIEEEETLSLHDKEVEMIKQALIRTNGRRKNAAKELGISERTLYRKIKQHNLGDVSDL